MLVCLFQPPIPRLIGVLILCFAWWLMVIGVYGGLAVYFLHEVVQAASGSNVFVYALTSGVMFGLTMLEIAAFRHWFFLRQSIRPIQAVEGYSIWEGFPESIRQKCLEALSDLSRSLDIPTPTLRPTLDVGMGVGSHIFSKRPELHFGLFLLVALPPPMLKAMLYHEFGHIKLGHVPILTMIGKLMVWCDVYPEDDLKYSSYWWFYSRFVEPLVSKSKDTATELRRSYEHEADVFAAKICGPRQYLKALKRNTALRFSGPLGNRLLLERLSRLDNDGRVLNTSDRLLFWYRMGLSKTKSPNQYDRFYPSQALREQRVWAEFELSEAHFPNLKQERVAGANKIFNSDRKI